jgi:hypothetical protein
MQQLTAICLVTLTLCAAIIGAQPADGPDEGLPSIAEKTAGCERVEGLLTTWIDRQKGRIWLEVPAPGDRGLAAELLYVEGLLTGLGSNPVGLDRGQLGPARLVHLRRIGNRVLLEEVNLRFRALNADPAEERAVRQSFATSVMWAEQVAAVDADGRSLVDLTSWLVRDAHGVAARFRDLGQGTFQLDAKRSVVDIDAFLAFSDNLEFEAVLTFESTKPGQLVRATAPSGEAVTLIQHQSLIRLPDDGYSPRRFDPRCASFPISFTDYAAPLDAPIITRWIVRHRLEKVDPSAERSRVREPIVYYVDRGAPEPVRSALVAGASWWADAFEAAGFVDAYRVELLPEGAHPLDVRYNVIQWVHRSTRGWSYGGGMIDPRTGEMIKGHVSLGSLRVRHDRLLMEGLVGIEQAGSGNANDPVQVALARIRQLSAHEVGHTLGFTHNFAASTYGGRASVMDYPAPLVELTPEGEIDLSNAYGVGVAEWDLYAVRYAYSQAVPGTDEDDLLAAIVREGIEQQLLFMADADARPLGSAHPLAHLWDNGADPVVALEHAFKVRQVAIERFGKGNIADGRPLSRLAEIFSPLYLYHRYQLTAAVKLVGGLDYTYAVKGDRQGSARPVDGSWQRRSLTAVLHGLDPAVLVISEQIIDFLLPTAFGLNRSREEMSSTAAPAFDSLGAAATAADLVVHALLSPERCSRLVDQHRRDPTLPSLEEMLQALLDTAFATTPVVPEQEEIRRVVQRVVLDRMVDRLTDPATPSWVRSRVESSLEDAHKLLEVQLALAGGPQRAHIVVLLDDIERFQKHREWRADVTWRAPDPPPGAPIGGGTVGCAFEHRD